MVLVVVLASVRERAAGVLDADVLLLVVPPKDGRRRGVVGGELPRLGVTGTLRCANSREDIRLEDDEEEA